MTMPEMARLLLITRKEVYNILLTGRDKDQFEFVYIADRRRVTKDSFERWYAGQRKYRKLCDRSPEEIMATSLPDMASSMAILHLSTSFIIPVAL